MTADERAAEAPAQDPWVWEMFVWGLALLGAIAVASEIVCQDLPDPVYTGEAR